MNTDIEIRRGLPGDRDALVAFNLAMARETESGELDRETVKAGVAAVFQSKDGGLDRGFYLVATSPGGPDSKIGGGLLITYEWSEWRNGVIWWIQSCASSPAGGGAAFTGGCTRPSKQMRWNAVAWRASGSMSSGKILPRMRPTKGWA